MRHGRIGRTAGVAALLAFLALPVLAPVTSKADTTPSGLAKASSLSLSLSPQALANLVLPASLTQALAALPCNVGTVAANALTQTTTVALDASSNDGTLNGVAGDLISGEATSEAVHIGLKGIDQLVGDVEKILSGDLSCLTGNSSSLPVNVQSLLGQLQGSLGNVVAPLQSVLNQLGATLNINQVLHVTLDQNPLTSALLNLTTPLGNLQLAPFDAVAVSQAGAQKFGIPTGPQLEAHNTTTNLALGNSLPLGSLGNLSGLLTQLTTTVQGALNSLAPQITSLGGNAVTQTVVQTVCSTADTILGSTQAINCNSLPVDPTQAVAQLSPQLTALQTQLQNLLNGLPLLSNVLGQLPTSLNLNDLISTAGDTSSVLTQPQKGGVHSLATTSFLDLKVLQLVSDLLPQLGAGPLVELKGISSSAEAFVNGVDPTPPSGTVSFGELDVLGHAIPLTGLGTNQTITIPTPLGDLTVVISVGTPQTINNTVNRKTESASALQVQLINGDATGGHVITLLGVQQDPTILDIQVAGTQVDDSMTPVAASAPVQPTSANLPSTGMVGVFGLAGVGLLGLAAAGLRYAARHSRRAAGADPETPID